MELEDYETLRLVQERLIHKIQSFRTWEDFIPWVKEMTQSKFKAFILKCLDGVIADGDVKKADLLEAKAQLEG